MNLINRQGAHAPSDANSYGNTLRSTAEEGTKRAGGRPAKTRYGFVYPPPNDWSRKMAVTDLMRTFAYVAAAAGSIFSVPVGNSKHLHCRRSSPNEMICAVYS